MKCLEKDRGRGGTRRPTGWPRTCSATWPTSRCWPARRRPATGSRSSCGGTGGRCRRRRWCWCRLVAGIVGHDRRAGAGQPSRRAEAARAEGERQAKEPPRSGWPRSRRGSTVLGSSSRTSTRGRRRRKAGRCGRSSATGWTRRPPALDEAVGDPLVVARLQDRLGQSLLRLGQPKQAIRLLRQGPRPRRVADLGPDHPDTLDQHEQLGPRVPGRRPIKAGPAAVRRDSRPPPGGTGRRRPHHAHQPEQLGDLPLLPRSDRPGLPLLTETLDRRKAVLGPDDPATLGSMNNLAVGILVVGPVDRCPVAPRGDPASPQGPTRRPTPPHAPEHDQPGVHAPGPGRLANGPAAPGEGPGPPAGRTTDRTTRTRSAA